ncbi:myotubularin-related protein 9 [Neocloeon triangulifer]|uniref:myotubularin-related protein 9 n=1 Tax=Neocloeon triangulifer TaxID=2078957 RepID=UPI00286EB4F0|nr:myotubularin-related protein 9 [Neocloeon triangulifer]XP_059488043.1 myotubularin-related protein 9 [Neocloeon triangulifer]
MEFVELIKTSKVDNVTLYTHNGKQVEVSLCVSSHHLILSARKEGVEELWILHQNIDTVDRKPNGVVGGLIIVKCKDFRIIQLEINGYEKFTNVANSLEWLSTLDNMTLLYPFFYRPVYNMLEDGWSAFNTESEFSKLLVPGSNEEWRISYVNKDFSVCGSYPSAVVVPKNIDDDTLIAASKFRQGGRFPILSYKHEGSSVLLRASQPLAGPGIKRCKEDEKLVNSVLGPGKKGYIVDTRSQSLAQTAKARGGGVEPEAHYPLWKRVHKPIDRQAAYLDSLAKLVDAANDVTSSIDKWLSRVENSNWLSHVKDSLNCACLVAQCLDQEGASVLVHGSEGLDSTLLVASLAQIILNPDCRTVRGLEALVEREWLQAGHPFTLRHKKSCFSVGGSSVVPGSNKSGIVKGQQACTFLLFLDCVFQIHCQFPCSFEFNTHLLTLLFEHSYSSQFGTFLGNCEADREQLKLFKKTVSLWSHLNRPEVLPSLMNTMYEPNSRVIWPSVAPMSLILWRELFLRYSPASADGVSTRMKAANDAIMELNMKDKELRSKAAKLRRQLMELEKESIELGVLESPMSSAPTPADGNIEVNEGLVEVQSNPLF